jgi:aldehyde:ferredoxin oxidoreductase
VMERAKDTYYLLMGWDKKGVPFPEKVQALCIE